MIKFLSLDSVQISGLTLNNRSHFVDSFTYLQPLPGDCVGVRYHSDSAQD